MSVDCRVVNDVALNQILGPHTKIKVTLMRGLVAKWKQPVYFDFDVILNLSKYLITEGIESSGVKVCPIVSDLGGCGALWKELNTSATNASLENPANSNR